MKKKKCRFGFWIYDKWMCVLKGKGDCGAKEFEGCQDAVVHEVEE